MRRWDAMRRAPLPSTGSILSFGALLAVGSLLAVGTACKDRKATGVFELDPDRSGPVLPGGAVAAVDSDGDGLTDDEEAAMGLDPLQADTDGDGYDDNSEIEAFTDPADATDHPYQGGYPIAACRHDLRPTGDAPGEVTANFALTDQHGDTVRLHDFCDREVLLVTSAMWCAPCRDEAPHLQQWYDRWREQGLMVITLLGENEGSSPPSLDDLRSWANEFGLTHPVVSDAGWGVSNRWPGAYIPTQHLLGPGATVIVADTIVSEADIEANLP